MRKELSTEQQEKAVSVAVSLAYRGDTVIFCGCGKSIVLYAGRDGLTGRASEFVSNHWACNTTMVAQQNIRQK